MLFEVAVSEDHAHALSGDEYRVLRVDLAALRKKWSRGGLRAFSLLWRRGQLVSCVNNVLEEG